MSKKKLAVLIAFIAILSAVFYVNRTRGEALSEEFSRTEFSMDTVVTLRILSEDHREAERIAEDVFTKMFSLEKMLSRHAPEGEIAAINAAAGREAVAVSETTFNLIKRAINYSELKSGAFDLTVAPLLDLWGFTCGEMRIPAEDALHSALELVDYSQVVLDQASRTVFLSRKGMVIDLGGIAKGYIVDRGAGVLQEAGVRSAFLDAGGDIRVIGYRADGEPWRIGIRDPYRGGVIAVVPLVDSAIVTSGNYERFFEEDGRRYHHILDPGTGWPAPTLTSVTVIAEEAVDADALATLVFVLGMEEGKEFLESLDGIEGILIAGVEDIYITSGIKERVEWRR